MGTSTLPAYTLLHTAQRLWSILLGDLSRQPGCGLGHPAVGVSVGAGLGEAPRSASDLRHVVVW